MDIKNKLQALAAKISTQKESILTEEATKTAFVMPFIQLLGYDIFNPREVVPEFTADFGIKKHEKVDYAILQNGLPVILIECKHWKAKLDTHNSQLHRYLNATKARFGLLTNGITYKFFADLEEKNVMDRKAFFEFDIENINDAAVIELLKFYKTSFDVDKIIDNASNLKYSKAIKEVLAQELVEPSEEFIKFFIKKICSRRITQKALADFKEIVRKAINKIFREVVNERLQYALNKEEPEEEAEEESKIVTTEEEIEAYYIVRSVLRAKIAASRIVMRDQQSYCGVLLDDNNRKPICRLHFNSSKKYIGLFDQNKNEDKLLLNNLDEIYMYADRLLETVLSYDSKKTNQ